VPRAGAFDGILGVVLGVALVEALGGRRFSFGIEVIGFSEEEGVRFGIPFIGSRALVGELDDELLAARDANGTSVSAAICAFGLNPAELRQAQAADGAVGYLEFHIEQGPVLEELNLPLAVVESIAGQSRLSLTFSGKANHAGTTPMGLRRDALAGAAEWVLAVEKAADATPDLRATVGRLDVLPGAANVIPGEARVSLDVRHARDAVRLDAVEAMLADAQDIASRRSLEVSVESRYDQLAVAMDAALSGHLQRALEKCDLPVHRMASGAGHDAMILARRMPAAMLFLRSPGGISHHPDENVLVEDVAAALRTGVAFLEELEASRG
jgi:allantoate deiminase